MAHTGHHMPQKPHFHMSQQECALRAPVWVNGETAGKREGENYSYLNTQHCQKRASQPSTNSEL